MGRRGSFRASLRVLNRGATAIPQDPDLSKRQQVWLAKLLRWEGLSGEDRRFIRMVTRRVATGTFRGGSDNSRLKGLADQAGLSMEGL
jgi:hypothetical protein